MKGMWILLGIWITLFTGTSIWGINEELKLEEENKAIKKNYSDEIVRDIKRSDGEILVQLANGDLRKIEVNEGEIKELVVKELEVNLKEGAVDKVSKAVSDKQQKETKLTKEDVKNHYQDQDKIVLSIQDQGNGQYLVELVKEYVLVDTQKGKIKEVDREKKK